MNEDNIIQRNRFLEERLREYREREDKPILGKSRLYIFHLLNEQGELKKDWKELLYSRKTTSPTEWAMIEDLKTLTSMLEEKGLI